MSVSISVIIAATWAVSGC